MMLRRKEWTKIEFIDKGFSNDVKYHVVDKKNEHYIIRVADVLSYERKFAQFDYLKEIDKLNLNTSSPVEISLFDGEIYALLTWVEGNEAEEVLPTLDKKTQYEIGIKAGKILKKIHSIPVKTTKTWKEVYEEKLLKKIKKSEEMVYKHPHLETFKKYVFDNMHIIEKSPMKLQHGAYHIGNMVIGENLELGIITFDQINVADPVDDFKQFIWNVRISPEFMTGLVDGYHNGKPTKIFFKKLALYAADYCIANIAWASKFDIEIINEAVKACDETYEWYEGFIRIIPTWYDETLKEKYF